MKKRLLVVLLVLVVSLTSLFAVEHRTGFAVGGALQVPTIGITPVGEYNFGPASAYAGLGYYYNGWSSYFRIFLGGDYHLPGVFRNADLNFDLVASAGLRLTFDIGGKSVGSLMGIGIPITLTYYFDSVPLKVFARTIPELAISLSGWGGAGLGMYAELGAMYLF